MTAAALLSATVLVLALSLSNLVGTGHAQAVCNGTSCLSCISSPDCGYCKEDLGSSRCVEGTAAGPSDGSSCSGNDVVWSFSTCPDDCQSQGTCYDCSQSFPTCGWCRSSNGCIGSYKKDSCSSFENTPGPSACSISLPCPQIFNCRDCLTSDKYDCQWRPQISACEVVPAANATDPDDGEKGPIWTDANSCPSYDSDSGASRFFSVLSKWVLLV